MERSGVPKVHAAQTSPDHGALINDRGAVDRKSTPEEIPVLEDRSTTATRADAEFSALERDLQSLVERHREDLELVSPLHVADAINLLHYLGLRRHDEYDLQRRLIELGLSSLGRCEPHVMASLLAIHERLSGRTVEAPEGTLTFQSGRAALDTNTDALFGARPRGRVPRIMVTLDTECANDYAVVRRLVASGMDVARINGAHDGPEQWDQMATHVERASRDLDRPCAVMMDLAGPKLRTGPLESGPQVVRLRPRRDARGRPVAPAVFEFEPAGTSRDSRALLPSSAPLVPVAGEWLGRRRVGDEVFIIDTRGARRVARIVEAVVTGGRVRAEVWDTTYLETGLALQCGSDVTAIGELPHIEQYHFLLPGDAISVVRGGGPSTPWHHGQPGTAEITCSLTSVFASVRVGERILFDDGKLAGVIESADPDRFVVRISDAPASGAKLRCEKGINLPETDLHEPLIADADRPLLELAARRANMISLSFLRRGDDVDVARAELARLGAQDLGIVLKIETQAGFANLPDLLMHAMRSSAVGVMIARGDLAVEMGYARLAEVQEEILWLAEAAHLPVVWATEVLDRLARTGRPTRAEVTDAAMAQRAECVMLNKGPYVVEAVAQLDDILRRMARHQRKTVPLLRPLHSWSEF
jgi:pyruvate kinase